ncbi:MAG TPA: sulfite exporter TauE/SafE family protein [Acidobacteriota bacterium]|nr:sulfite exporter TauE/SafE family protein [Acidobacteriota bacterium]
MTEMKFKVIGMHCAACEHVVGKLLKNQKGIRSVHVNRHNEEVTLETNNSFSLERTNKSLESAGYSLVPEHSQVSSPMTKVWWTVVICALFMGAVWILTHPSSLSYFDAGALSDNVGLPSAFVLGLIASVSSCLAVTGGLLLALTSSIENNQKWNFVLSFGVGRLLSYGLLGGLLGLLGETLSLSARASAVLTIIVSIIMILLGLQLVGLVKVPSFTPKSWVKKIEGMTQNPNKTAIGAGVVGALTFFLPCGFTQALQLYALKSGNFFTGASLLFVFALGTLPVLMFVGSITKYFSSSVRKYAMVVAGIIVIILGAISVPAALTLYSVGGTTDTTDTTSDYNEVPSPIAGQVQEISMTVAGYKYEPSTLTVTAGVPVRWTINASKAAGCAKSLIAPSLGIRKTLSSTAPTVIEFTPTKKGSFDFSCSMGMAGPGTIIVK